MSDTVLILGSGFTGSRVAQRLRLRKISVVALRSADILEVVPADCVVLHSIPRLKNGFERKILDRLRGLARRVVYLSTTGVYGDAHFVDENTPVQPTTDAVRTRVLTEQAVAAGPWQSLILRPAAIYGPGRGVHIALREGRYAMPGEGLNFISRIHVDDLSAIAEASLFSDLTGAFPVADAKPCTSLEMAQYCSGLLGIALPPPGHGVVPETRKANRRVDGSAILRKLGLTLQYPSYLEGVPACLEAESSTMVEDR